MPQASGVCTHHSAALTDKYMCTKKTNMTMELLRSLAPEPSVTSLRMVLRKGNRPLRHLDFALD